MPKWSSALDLISYQKAYSAYSCYLVLLLATSKYILE